MDETKVADHVTAVTDSQTKVLQWWANVRTVTVTFVIPILTVVLGVAGFKIVPTTPTPAPEAIQQIIEILKNAPPPQVTVLPHGDVAQQLRALPRQKQLEIIGEAMAELGKTP